MIVSVCPQLFTKDISSIAQLFNQEHNINNKKCYKKHQKNSKKSKKFQKILKNPKNLKNKIKIKSRNYRVCTCGAYFMIA